MLIHQVNRCLLAASLQIVYPEKLLLHDSSLQMNRSSQTQSVSSGSSSQKPGLWQRILAFISPAGARKNDSRNTRDTAFHSTPASSQLGKKAGRRSSSRQQARAGRPLQKPETVDVSTSRLYVGNLAFQATPADLTELFKPVGEVKSVEIISHSKTQRSKGFGFVQMGSIEEAKCAVERLHDQEFLGRKLVVSGAKKAAFKDAGKE